MVTTRGHCTPLRITPEGNTDHWSRGHVLWLFAKQKEKKHAWYPTANPPYDGHPSGIVRKSRSAAPPESERRACLRPSTGLHESVRLRVCCQRAAAPPYLTCCQRAARSCAGPHAHHLVDKPPIAFTNAGERHARTAAARRELRATKSHSDRRECCEPTLPAAHPRCVSAAPSSRPALRLVRSPGPPVVRRRLNVAHVFLRLPGGVHENRRRRRGSLAQHRTIVLAGRLCVSLRIYEARLFPRTSPAKRYVVCL